MNREDALSLLKENLSNENLVKHCLAVEAIMKKTAEYLQEDTEKWGLVGLLHDIDYEKTKDNTKAHATIGAEMLSGMVDEEITKAIKSHNFENTGVVPETRMELCLVAADAVSGLVIACALVMPSKRLNDVRLDTVKEKFKTKDFARNCNRGKMLYCEKINIEKDKFFELSLNALQNIAEDLGL